MLAVLLVAVSSATLGQVPQLNHVDTYAVNLSYPARIASINGGGIYVTDPPMNRVVEYDDLGAFVAMFDIPATPIGITTHTDGRVFVSHADGTVGVYDAGFVLLGLVNPAPFTMAGPNDMAYHPIDGELYVVDSAGHQIIVFEEVALNVWSLARMWGAQGSALGEFQSPQSVAIDTNLNHVIVTDVDNFRVQVFDTAGTLLFKFGYRILFTNTSQIAWFARSEGLAVDSLGNIYIADALMGTVRTFDAGGNEIDPAHLPLLNFGVNPGNLRVPCDLMFDLASDTLFVASTNNATVEVYDVTYAAPSPIISIDTTVSAIKLRGQRDNIVVMPDNPFEIVAAIEANENPVRLDLNRDRVVDEIDLQLAAEHFDGATAEDMIKGFHTNLLSVNTFIDPPHFVDLTYACGRCHSMEGLPGGMLTAEGQANLCQSCHTPGGIATNMPMADPELKFTHPIGVPADQGISTGPTAGSPSEMEYHLDNGDIRCGTCHQPHNSKAGAPNLRAGQNRGQLCAECHKEVGEWLHAGHADESADPWSHYDWALPNRSSCRQCHSGNGFIDASKGIAPADQRGEFRVLDCTVCHAAHGTAQDDTLLRIYHDVTLPTEGPDQTLTGQGAMATCMACHNGRYAPDDGNLTPHYALGGVMLEGVNGKDFGHVLTNSQHTVLGVTCMNCHMAPSPAAGMPGAGKVGGHSFNMKVHDPADPDFGFENIANSCNAAQCHGGSNPVTSINRTAYGDYDGDGTIEGVQDEVQALMDMVFAEIQVKGAVFLGHYPYWDLSGLDYTNAVCVGGLSDGLACATDADCDDLVVGDAAGNCVPPDEQLVRDAIWNYEYVDNSGDLGIKNTGYAVGLLQVTILELTGDDVLGADLRYTPRGFGPTEVAIQSVNGNAPVVVGNPFSVDFTIEDGAGMPVPMADLNRLRVNISGPTTNYQLVIYQDGTAANFVQNMDGSYTYSLPTLPGVYLAPLNDSPDLVDGEMTGLPLVEGTYTVGIETRRVFGSARKASDATLDFVVADNALAPPAIDPRQIVTQNACNQCHNDLQLHGGNRFSVTGCVLCHTRGGEDRATNPASTVGVTIQLGDMIHKIHRGHDLSSIGATANSVDPYRYIIRGFNASVIDFSDVGFPVIPMGVNDCDACHGGATDGGDIYTNITRANCGGCHEDIDFTTGTILDKSNPAVSGGLLTQAELSDPMYRVMPGGITHDFIDDTGCSTCHAAGAPFDAVAAHQHATVPAKEGTIPMVEIVSVTGMTGGGGTYFVPGDLPEVTFKLSDSMTSPMQLVPGDSSILNRMETIVSGPTTQIQTILPQERFWSNGNYAGPKVCGAGIDAGISCSSSTDCDLAVLDDALGTCIPDPAHWKDNYSVDGTYTYTYVQPFPVYYPAQLNTIGEAPADQIFPFAEGWGQMYTAAGTVLDNGTYTAVMYGRRSTPIAGASEPVMTGTFDFAFGVDSPVVPYAGTITTDKCNACHGRLAFHGNQREGIESCLACHTAGTQDGGTSESVDFRIMIHKLHNAQNLTNLPYELNGFGGIDDFSHLLISSMPGGAAECQVCHANDDWKTPPVRPNMRTWMSACTSCHDAATTAAHADMMTTPGTFDEQCMFCHGDGTLFSVESVHETP